MIRDVQKSTLPILGGPWAAYAPSEPAPWNLRRVAHLHRRAAFGATWGEMQRDLGDGPEASVSRLLAGTTRSEGVSQEFEKLAGRLAESAVVQGSAGRLKAWWVYRMLFGPDPLGERLTLLWHNHFATSNLKVKDLAAMHRQNQTFRELARAPFGKLLGQSVREPALLIWLDAQANRKEHPNENLARELMELFTLGIGNYTEEDVKEAARALTGWTASQGIFRELRTVHDPGTKTVLGKAGAWNGDDLLQILLAHPATADRLARRLCETFLADGVIGSETIADLARGLRERDLDLGWAVETILRSQAFFAEANLGTQVLPPLPALICPVRVLELFDRPPSTLAMADWAARLGQDLFYPPNVGGWPGGRAWISTRSIISRANYAAALLGGDLTGGPPFDALAFAEKHGVRGDLDRYLSFYGQLLLGAVPGGAPMQGLEAELGPQRAARPERLRRAVVLLLASPEAHLA